MILSSILHPDVLRALLSGQLVVMKSDTIYGIMASANSPEATKKLYDAKHRNSRKSSIILVSDVDDIPSLSPHHTETYLELNQERPTTIVVPVDPEYLPHLVRQQGTLAFRLVKPSDLAELISKTGPLLAPSANTAAHTPATNISEAMSYFGDSVAIYVDGGTVENIRPSKIIAINDSDEIEIIRD